MATVRHAARARIARGSRACAARTRRPDRLPPRPPPRALPGTAAPPPARPRARPETWTGSARRTRRAAGRSSEAPSPRRARVCVGRTE
ncbi:MAG: hypothetical protein EXR63_03770 [Dehalococcoidia bacterium]|nr:hypothetical protein [Dehalococcoidia bacterium]